MYDLYALYQTEVWDACLQEARRARPAAADPDVRRDAARRFVRACMSYRSWSARAARADGGSEAWLAPAAEA